MKIRLFLGFLLKVHKPPGKVFLPMYALQLELTGTGAGPRQQQEGNLGLSVGSAGGGAALADIGITGPRLPPAATSITAAGSDPGRNTIL